MRHARRSRTLPAAVVATLLLAGCGSSSSDQVRTTLMDFAQASANHDYKAICEDFLAPSLVDQVEEAGVSCEAALRPELSSTKEPTLSVRSVTVHGDRAAAVVHTTAANQRPSDDTIELVLIKDRWRISSLAGPAGPQPPAGP